MTIDFYDAGNVDGLFNILGKAFHAQATINTARATTIPTEILDAITSFNLLTTDAELVASAAPMTQSSSSIKGVGSAEISQISSYCKQFLIEFVNDDNPLGSKTLSAALEELIRQMEAGSESVDGTTLSIVNTPGSNTGDGVIVFSTKLGTGVVAQNAFSETIDVEAASDGLTASIKFSGEEAVSLLSGEWPEGSGTANNVSAIPGSSSLLLNGDMEDEDDVANSPDDWIISVGVIGTTVKMTDVEVQTVIIGSGTPTTGHYLLTWVNSDSDSQTTEILAYSATGSAVETALRKLDGLEDITVVTTGNSPNFTHTITFTGRGGNVSQLTSTNNTDGGIAHATTTAGTAEVFAGGKAMEWDSDGAELTTMQQALTTLAVETSYAVSLWALADVTPAAGVITIDLVDGIGGTVIADAEGTNNTFTFNAADLTQSWQHLDDLVSGEIVFRTPSVLPDLVYFRIRISTAVSAGTSVFVDHIAFAKMTPLYSGGPPAAVFSGAVEFKKTTDTWSIAVTNNRLGLIQEWFNRNYDMSSLGLMLPSDSGGSETIPDTVVS